MIGHCAQLIKTIWKPNVYDVSGIWVLLSWAFFLTLSLQEEVSIKNEEAIAKKPIISGHNCGLDEKYAQIIINR